MMLRLSPIDFLAISPFLILLGGALITLLVETFGNETYRKSSKYFAAVFLLAAGVTTYYAPASSNTLLTPWLRFDSLALFFNLFFIATGLISVLLAASFFHSREESQGEYYFLLLSAVLGLMLIGSAADFLMIFLGIETLSIALYILTGYIKKWTVSGEAALKYFLLGAVAAAFLLYGFALVYGAIGTTRLDQLLASYKKIDLFMDEILFLGGVGFITVGLAFKAAIVPFHSWAPDVYDGAPTPVTAFMSVGTKAGAFSAFILIFLIALPGFSTYWSEGVALLAIPTLLYANFVAMRQTHLRRFFAYSGIAHSGYLLLPLAAGGPDALQAMLYYIVVYAAATFGAFAVLAAVEGERQDIFVKDLYGLFKRSPLYAALMALCLLTLAGIPPTAGFFAKFFLIKTAFAAGYYGLAITALLMAILAAYFYLRIAIVMFTEEPAEEQPPHRLKGALLVGIATCAAIVVITIYPDLLLLHIAG